MSEGIHHLPRMGINAACRVYGVTARALRFYEEHGLIQARRDRYNVRYYDGEARARLDWISRLRRSGVSLVDIAAILDAEGPDAAGALALAAVQGRVQALQEQLDAALAMAQELSLRAPAAQAAAAG